MKEEILAETREFINKMKNWGKILEEITLAWEELFLEILLFQFERYPIEDVRLIFGNPCFFAQKLGGLLTIRIRYWDSLGNEYKPISIPIEVIDKRTRKSPQDVPININWIRERIIPGELD